MKRLRYLGLSLMLASLTCFSGALAQPVITDPILGDTHLAGAPPVVEARDPQRAVEHFLERIHQARIALALEEPSRAKEEIGAARTMFPLARSVNAGTFRLMPYTLNGAVYAYPPETSDVPAQRVVMRTLKQGPVLSNEKGLAVAEVEVVSLTLDLSGTRPQRLLEGAVQLIDSGDYNGADANLATLLLDVVKKREVLTTLPWEEVQDNVVLAKDFIAAGRYAGARFALDQAEEGLMHLKQDNRHTGSLNHYIVLYEEIAQLQARVRSVQPTLGEAMSTSVERWWQQLVNLTS